jgi:hypothetical protein
MSQVFDKLFPKRIAMEPVMFQTLQSKIHLPPIIKIRTENFQEFLKEFLLYIGSAPGLAMTMQFTKPSSDDETFASEFTDSLSRGNLTEQSNTLLRDLEKAKGNYEIIDMKVKTYLISCAGTDEILRRKFLNHQGDAYSLVQELSLDYNKKSNDNAIVARRKMYDLKYSPTTTNEEFINMLEEAAVAIENAGGTIDEAEMALIILNQAQTSERYQMKVTSYMSTNEGTGFTPTWAQVKARLLEFDRSTKPLQGNTSDTPSNLKIMYTDDGKKKKHKDKNNKQKRHRFCTREGCMTRHPDGEHIDGSKNKSSVPEKRWTNDQLLAAAVEVLEQKQGRRSFNSRGNHQFSNSFHRNRGDRYRPDEESNSFNGDCYICHKPGHTQWECRHNPKSPAYTGKKPGYHSRDRANFTRDAEDSDSAEYYAALERSTKGKFSANVLRDNVAAHALFTAFENEFMMLYDTAATKIFVKNRWHRLANSRKINKEVSTAGRGKLVTIREGFIGRASVYGMSDELQVQLVGGRALAALGYTISINDDGATFTHEDDTPTSSPYFVPWTDDLLPVDIRKLKVFQLSPIHLSACTAYDRFNTPFTETIRQETTEEGPFTSKQPRYTVHGGQVKQPSTIGDWMLIDDA